MGKQRLFIINLVLLICLFVCGCSSTSPSSGESTNLLQNGSFEKTGSGWLTPWGFQSSGIATIHQTSETPANGAYSARITITQSRPADSAVQLSQGNLPLTEGELYTFIFWAKASRPRTIRPAIGHAAPWTPYFGQDVTLTTAWHQYALRFTVPQTDTNGMILFNLANATGEIWLASVSLQPTGEPTLTPFTNFLQNGSFEKTGSGWLAPWVFEPGGIAAIHQTSETPANGVYSARITITRSRPADSAVQLSQVNLPLIEGELYTFIFWAKASRPRAIRPAIGHATPWTPYFGQDVTLTTAWHQYTFTFIPPRTDTNGMILFNLANATGEVWLANISLEQSI
jgi:hypothetical protein